MLLFALLFTALVAALVCSGIEEHHPAFLAAMGVKLDISTDRQTCVAGDVVEGSVRVDVTTVSSM